MSAKNLIVRGGADFSSIKREFQKTQQQMNAFQASVNKTMSGIGKAFKIGLGYISARAIAGFVKETTKWGSDVAEIQNVVNVTFGDMTKDIEEFSKSAMDNFGLSELAAKKYSSTMGAMLKSSGVAGEAVRDMSIDLARLTADMASFHNKSNEEVFKKIMSGMSGMSMPLKELGINMNVANLEAFAMSQGIKKAYKDMAQAEQAMLRYNYLMSVTGDMQGDFSRNAHNWGHSLKILSEQWNTLKGTIGQGFINALMPVITWLNVAIKRVQVLAESFRALTVALFGNTQAGRATSTSLGYIADSLEDAEEGFGDVGKAGKKAAKDLKGSIAGFDELNTLADKTANSMGGIGEELGGVGPVDLGTASGGELDIDTSKIEGKFAGLKKTIEDFYANWGIKDIFDGIKSGADLIDFSTIKENFKTTFQGWGEIVETTLTALQPMFQARGEVWGTYLKYGIATWGNIFEPIALGFANFTANMKGPIQDWINETSQTIVSGYKGMGSVFENVGQAWLGSIEEYKEPIAKAVEETLANISETFMGIGTIAADTFEIITGKINEFIENNKKDIQIFTDSILGIFTDTWNLINQVWTDALNIIKEFWNEWGAGIVEGVMDFVKDVGKWFLYLWNGLVKPTWDTMMTWLKKIWNENLKGIVEELIGFVGRVGELILLLWNTVFKPLIDKIVKVLVPMFRDNFKFILDIVGSTVNGIAGIVKNLLKILNGIIDFVAGVFTGDWKRAWQGVSNVFKGIVDGLISIFKIPLNAIISSINSFLRGLNKIKIPDWVPGVGGKGFNIPEIPHLKKGGITNGPMVAVIGDNPGGREVVSPLDDLQDMIVSAVGTAMLQANQMGNNARQIVIKTYLDSKVVAREIYDPLEDEKDRRGDNMILQPI